MDRALDKSEMILAFDIKLKKIRILLVPQ